jgi:RNA polymerase sigma-70 factor (ECF subfamily)
MADRVPTWEEVARDYGRFLYSVAYRLAGNDDDAQDLVQESLIRIRKGLERYEPGSLEGWLARIVTNVFLDEVRRRKRRPTDALPDDPERVLPTTPAADEVPTGLSDEVQRALGSLPDDFRVPVVLSLVIAGLTQAIYPYLYSQLLGLDFTLLLVLTARNILYVVLLVWAVAAIIDALRWEPELTA